MKKSLRRVVIGVGGLLVMTLGGAAGLMAMEKKPAAPSAGTRGSAGLATPTIATDFLDGASYVGSKACGECHENEYKQWLVSGHANMLRPLRPEIVKGDFSGGETAYRDVEVEDADKKTSKISPKVRTETRDGKYLVTLLDADNPANDQSYEVVEVLGAPLWEQQYYLKVGDQVFPSPVRWVDKDGQWRKKPFHPYWWVPDGTADGRPRTVAEMPRKKSVLYQCDGCHTTGFSVTQGEQGRQVFSRQEGGIGCEACHGPGSKHVAAEGQGAIVNPAKLGTVQQQQLCGQCHSRVTSKQDKDFAFPLGFRVGQSDLHERLEFWSYSTKPKNFFPNGDAAKNRQQYHDTMGSAHLDAGVTCISCHLDHAATHRAASLRQPREQICAGCHAQQTAMFQNSVHAKEGVACVDCHMAPMGNRAGATAKTAKSPVDVSAHTIRPVLPMTAEAYTMRSSCDKCHKEGDRQVYGDKLAQQQREVLTLLTAKEKQQQGGKPALSVQARENLRQVQLDGSLGAHDFARTIQLLREKK